MSQPEIFKMQSPIFSTDADAGVLIYNEDRSICFEHEGSIEVQELFGDEKKIFVSGAVDGEGNFKIFSEAPWQDW